MAKDAVTCTEFHFDSTDGQTRIHALKWEPVLDGSQNLVGIVQIVHGMVEHIERYDDFARFLAANGYAVCAEDHIGHGASVESPEHRGELPEDGARVMVADVHTLRTMMQNEYPDETPYYLFGHSMGSFIVRAYLARYGRGLAGAIVCGTGQQPLVASRFAGALSRNIGRRKGFAYRSKLMEGLAMGAYAKAVKDARTPFDWLNTDPAKVEEYIADPACGMMFSVGGYASLTDLTAEVATRQCVERVPEGLPVLFIAGAEDPVGDNGKGVRAAAQAMQQYSKAQVETKIYDGMRHEILNEPRHAEVYADVLTWLAKIGEDAR
ncbi:MAG: lysophospholipase [Eggerthellaceae bacterium]|nr:lysophospholipase [Eggerthellaceae bacterium]